MILNINKQEVTKLLDKSDTGQARMKKRILIRLVTLPYCCFGQVLRRVVYVFYKIFSSSFSDHNLNLKPLTLIRDFSYAAQHSSRSALESPATCFTDWGMAPPNRIFRAGTFLSKRKKKHAVTSVHKLLCVKAAALTTLENRWEKLLQSSTLSSDTT